MTAQIIQFPRKKPLGAHELPEYWTPYYKAHYLHATSGTGRFPHHEVFEECEAMSKIVQQPGEKYLDYLKRAAQEEIALAIKSQQP